MLKHCVEKNENWKKAIFRKGEFYQPKNTPIAAYKEQLTTNKLNIHIRLYVAHHNRDGKNLRKIPAKSTAAHAATSLSTKVTVRIL